MARSRFSAWIDRQSDENAEVIRRGRPIRERLMRIFDRQRLATWLFYAIITLFLVSCVTTGLALYKLLIAGTQADLAGSEYFDLISRMVVAAGTTFGIQTIALVLSLFFGGQAVRLFTASQVPKDLPFWSRALRLATSRGLQVAGVLLIGGLLVPFLAFSIAFSYATFHHTLEREEEIRRKALIEIPQLVREARAPILVAIRRDIDRVISSWVPTTAPLDSNGHATAQDRLTERDALRDEIKELQDMTLPSLLDEKSQADEADANTGARRKQAVEEALARGLGSLRGFVQEHHEADARLAGALAGERLDVLLGFAAVIDGALLSDVTARLKGSFKQMSCIDTGTKVETNRENSRRHCV